MHAARKLPGLALLVALLGLVLTAAPIAAQEDAGVECDEDFFIDEDDDVVYFLFSGGTLSCVATGLDPDDPAEWQADFYDVDGDLEVPDSSDGDDLDVDAEGTAEFEIDIPTEPRFLWMNGFVVQGELELLFFGTTEWAFDMECEPDPVEQGGTVSCFPEEMTPGAFTWLVVFYDADDEELEDHEVEGDGTAEDDGTGTFEFGIPDDDAIVAYTAFVEQADYLAEFDGEVVAPDEQPPPPAPPTPPTPQPVAVPQPTRVDTGGGGTAPDSGWPLAFTLVGIVAAGLVARRHRTRTST